jgi:hypothetical protein
MNRGRLRSIPRLLAAIALFGGSFLVPARSSAFCDIQCLPMTWIQALNDCIDGAGNSCHACFFYCPRAL